MSISKTQKVEQLVAIKSWLQDPQTLVIFQYHGLSVPRFEQLRRQLFDQNGQLRVFKNRLFKLALADHQFSSLSKYLTGPNAFVRTAEVNSRIPQLLYQFSRQHPALKLNAAVYDQELLSPAQLLELASLPSKTELLANLTGVLLSPLKLLTATLQAIIGLRSKT